MDTPSARRRSTTTEPSINKVLCPARTSSVQLIASEEFGKWSSAFHQFQRWTLAAPWVQIMDTLK
jgi:hypothetical protein